MTHNDDIIPGWQSFVKLCQKADSIERLDQILEVFLTHEEKVQIGQRIRLTQALLDHQLPQREIANQLQVSIAKITRGSNQMKRINQALRDYLKQNIDRPPK